MEAATKSPAETTAIEKLVPGVEHFKKVFAHNTTRVSNALAVTKKIIMIPEEDETLDEYANTLLVKCNKTFKEVQADRLAATKILDEAKAWAMGPEKELEAEIKRIADLRNKRARAIEAKRLEEQQAVEREKAFKAHEGQVKIEMQTRLEKLVGKKLVDLEEYLADLFNKVKLSEIPKFEKGLAGMKPGLKPEFYETFFDVPYNQNIMDEKQFADLQYRAKGYWTFEKINEGYVKTATEVIKKWSDKIPQKKKELEKIAQGGAAAEKIQQQAEQRAKAEEQERKQQQQQQESDIEKKKIEEQGRVVLETEFEAQNKLQDLAQQQEGTRTTRTYRVNSDYEKDMVKFSGLIGRVILHLMSEPDFKKRGGLFKLDKSGAIKKDDIGNPIYADWLADLLSECGRVKYALNVPGLEVIEKVSTVARAK